MKNLFILAAFVLALQTVTAQKTIEKNINHTNQVIDLDVKFAHKIVVKTWNKSTVYFKAELSTEGGKYLDLYELDVKEDNNYINIVSDPTALFKAYRAEWKNSNKKSYNGYYHQEYEFNYVLYVPTDATFNVSSINGSLTADVIDGDFTADLINGDIDIKKYSGNMELKTINGEIDLVMANSHMVAETIHGNIYADEKLTLKVTDRHVGQKVEGSFENAAYKLRLNTINGNMYLRK